jgi:hypothetical protein
VEACQGGGRPVLLRSVDGVEWVEIDLAPLELSSIERIVDVADHGMMVIGHEPQSPRLATWTWSSGDEPPRRPLPNAASPDEVPLVAFGDRLTVGATYRFPLHFHCGIELLGSFNDRWWYLVEGSTQWDPTVDSPAAPPANWPVANEFIFGTITLVDADTIEYTIPSGEVIAIYEASTVEPELCA